jgi:hypothetical protein
MTRQCERQRFERLSNPSPAPGTTRWCRSAEPRTSTHPSKIYTEQDLHRARSTPRKNGHPNAARSPFGRVAGDNITRSATNGQTMHACSDPRQRPINTAKSSSIQRCHLIESLSLRNRYNRYPRRRTSPQSLEAPYRRLSTISSPASATSPDSWRRASAPYSVPVPAELAHATVHVPRR